MIHNDHNENTPGDPLERPASLQENMKPFKHKEILRSAKKEGTLSRKRVIGLLNHINFTDGDLFIHVRFTNEEEELLLRIKPDPCQGDVIKFRFSEKDLPDSDRFQFLNFIIDDGRSLIVFKADIVSKDGEALLAKIPKTADTFSIRKSKRNISGLIKADFRYGEYHLKGTLEDFNFEGMRVKLDGESLSSVSSIVGSRSVWMELRHDKNIIYAGDSYVSRYNERGRYVIVAPTSLSHSLFPPTKERSPRIKLVPMPKITFLHPFNNRKLIYDLRELGTTGFSIEEPKTEAQLIPGMVFKNMDILFPGGFKLSCSARIIFSNTKGKTKIVHGLCILDMNAADYFRLFDIVSNASDPLSKMTSEIDMEELWEFFFKSGFIYPNKYQSLSANKDEFRQTYEKLYKECPEIFTCLSYQKNGRIYGHNCAIKAYQRAWMIHHLAALPLKTKQVGLELLKQSHAFYDGLHRLPSIGMDYMVIYYRPNNKFPDYFFGGFCRHIKDPKICSMDLFAYYHMPMLSHPKLPQGEWELGPCTHEDYVQLRTFYEDLSGGLMLDMFGTNEHYPEEPLEKVYKRLGLKRRCKVYSLKNKGIMKAVLFVDEANLGTNLSELLNSIKVIVTDQEGLSREILENVTSIVGQRYHTDTVTVMVYPYEYATSHGIKYDKQYYLWIINSKFGSIYVDFIRGLLKFKTFKYLKFVIKRMLR